MFHIQKTFPTWWDLSNSYIRNSLSIYLSLFLSLFHTHSHTYTQTHKHTHINTHTYIHTLTHTSQAYSFTHTNKHTTRKYSFTHTHTTTHTYTHIFGLLHILWLIRSHSHLSRLTSFECAEGIIRVGLLECIKRREGGGVKCITKWIQLMKFSHKQQHC